MDFRKDKRLLLPFVAAVLMTGATACGTHDAPTSKSEGSAADMERRGGPGGGSQAGTATPGSGTGSKADVDRKAETTASGANGSGTGQGR